MCPHEPEGEYGHINQIMTAHVTCVVESCISRNNGISNFLL